MEILSIFGIIQKDKPSSSIISTFVNKKDAEQWIKPYSSLMVVEIHIPCNVTCKLKNHE